jgi:hypothetical protein
MILSRLAVDDTHHEPRRGITWLAASIRRGYLRAASPTDHIVVSVFYDGDWRAAYLDISRY